MRNHQEAIAKAAADAVAEEARQKEALWASMSPEQRADATKLHDQQAAVGAHVFGTQEASQVVGLVHKSHVHDLAHANVADEEEEVERLMQMSPEGFARWDQEQQSLL